MEATFKLLAHELPRELETWSGRKEELLGLAFQMVAWVWERVEDKAYLNEAIRTWGILRCITVSKAGVGM